MNSITKSIKHYFEKHAQLWASINLNLLELGQSIAEAVDEFPDYIDQFCEEHPEISHEYMHRLEMVGRRQICPKIAMAEAPGAGRLRKMPLQLQEKYSNEPIPVVVIRNDGTETLNVDVLNLTPKQAQQVFDTSRREVRSEAAQRAWLEDKMETPVKPKAVSGPRIRRGVLEVVDQSGIVVWSASRKDLARMLAEME